MAFVIPRLLLSVITSHGIHGSAGFTSGYVIQRDLRPQKDANDALVTQSVTASRSSKKEAGVDAIDRAAE